MKIVKTTFSQGVYANPPKHANTQKKPPFLILARRIVATCSRVFVPLIILVVDLVNRSFKQVSITRDSPPSLPQKVSDKGKERLLPPVQPAKAVMPILPPAARPLVSLPPPPAKKEAPILEIPELHELPEIPVVMTKPELPAAQVLVETKLELPAEVHSLAAQLEGILTEQVDLLKAFKKKVPSFEDVKQLGGLYSRIHQKGQILLSHLVSSPHRELLAGLCQGAGEASQELKKLTDGGKWQFLWNGLRQFLKEGTEAQLARGFTFASDWQKAIKQITSI